MFFYYTDVEVVIKEHFKSLPKEADIQSVFNFFSKYNHKHFVVRKYF